LNEIEQRWNDVLTTKGKEPETITRLEQLAEAMQYSTRKLVVSIGPKSSASERVAQAILESHDLMTSISPYRHPVSDMVGRLGSGDVDMGVFVSHVPSGALRTILDSEDFKLLSVGPQQLGQLTWSVFELSEIKAEKYACQWPGEPDIQTIATQAVLVTREDLRFDVKTVTKAVFDAVAYLGVEGLTKEDMARPLGSLVLHPQAEEYYMEAKPPLLTPPPRVDWLAVMWRILAIVVILVGGYKGVLTFRRQRTANRIGRRILAVPLEGKYEDSAEQLLDLRNEIQERVRRRWWRWGELDKPRWRYLHDLIGDQLRQARANLTRALVAEVRSLAPFPELDEAEPGQHLQAIERRIWKYYEEGELDSSQHEKLLGLLRNCRQSMDAGEGQHER
jgi:hypothetical protein